jgi:hypothetical protein
MFRRIAVVFKDSRRDTDDRPGYRVNAEQQVNLRSRVADLQRVIAMLLKKNEELRQQLVVRSGEQDCETGPNLHGRDE